MLDRPSEPCCGTMPVVGFELVSVGIKDRGEE